MQVGGILEACLYALDLEASEQFYAGILGLEVIAREPGRHVFFRCGRSVFLLFNPARTRREQTSVGGAPIPLHGTYGAGHLAFSIPAQQLANWRTRLQQAGVEIESEVAWPHGGRSIYVRDPAGNSIELASPALWGLPEA